MTAMKNLRIGTRLGGAFALVALLMIGMAVNSWMGLRSIRSDLDSVVNDRYEKVKLANAINEGVNLQARAMRNILLMDTEAQRQPEIKVIEEARERIVKLYADLDKRVNSPKGRELLDRLQRERAIFLSSQAEFLKMVQAGDLAAARTLLLEKLRPHQLAYMKLLDEMGDFQEKLMDRTAESAFDTISRVTLLSIGGTLLGLAMAVVAGVVVTRSITRPVATVVDELKTVAGGDLTVNIVADRGDELGELQRALADTVGALRSVVGRVRQGVDSVTTASSQIAAGNQDLSSRTEQQASSLQETASSMEELTATVRQSADSARAASSLAAQASTAASRGGDVVGQVVGTMDDISTSSRKIVDIIGVIDGIAFQTNILALNAAVEAARAGEQGRGFAVVATEVRTLAQRSAEAAKEIKALIGASVERVEAGSRQVADAGHAMHEIVEQVRKVNDLIGEIASTAGEQSRGIDQINTAVTQMDQVTQQNAALVEESAAAASSLAQQADSLSKAVSAFRIDVAQMARQYAPAAG
ncbi:methyl-accepting chemotaxis protein [Roseateles cellulosilyticus]|uniref:methyl-accepting chemotaxis protein n=1 Tax=Pelomonas cellulosilytica TaxID=2906762 RepID=UPI002103EC90|nr:methyl-accepting chemotaxis protein [Pelomonas sp. P8]